MPDPTDLLHSVFGFSGFRPGQAEMEPLVKVAHMVLDDLQLGAVPGLFDDADIAGVEGAGDGDGHGKPLRSWMGRSARLIVRDGLVGDSISRVSGGAPKRMQTSKESSVSGGGLTDSCSWTSTDRKSVV